MRTTVMWALAAGTVLASTVLTAPAGEFRPVGAETLAGWLGEGRPVAVVDVQPSEGYREHRFVGSILASDPRELEALGRALAAAGSEVVVVSAAGGDEALQAARGLVRAGVEARRIAVLEGGMAAAAARAQPCTCCQVPGEAGK